MRNTVIKLITCIIFLSIFNFFLSFETSTASGSIISVDDSGGADYINIQYAINAANESDTIYVYSGTYNENILIITELLKDDEDEIATHYTRENDLPF